MRDRGRETKAKEEQSRKARPPSSVIPDGDGNVPDRRSVEGKLANDLEG